MHTYTTVCCRCFSTLGHGIITARVSRDKAHWPAEVRVCTVLRGVQAPKTASLYAYVLSKMSGTTRSGSAVRSSSGISLSIEKLLHVVTVYYTNIPYNFISPKM